jgi:hypothetical protein
VDQGGLVAPPSHQTNHLVSVSSCPLAGCSLLRTRTCVSVFCPKKVVDLRALRARGAVLGGLCRGETLGVAGVGWGIGDSTSLLRSFNLLV